MFGFVCVVLCVGNAGVEFGVGQLALKQNVHDDAQSLVHVIMVQSPKEAMELRLDYHLMRRMVLPIRFLLAFAPHLAEGLGLLWRCLEKNRKNGYMKMKFENIQDFLSKLLKKSCKNKKRAKTKIARKQFENKSFKQ